MEEQGIPSVDYSLGTFVIVAGTTGPQGCTCNETE